MLALSIRQPWASLILTGGKDVENRCWPTKIRGRVLVHAAKGCTRAEMEAAREFAWERAGVATFDQVEDLLRGGIIGSVEIVDCVRVCASPWFVGEFGFLLRDPQPLPFTPWKGQLGFFDVPDSALHTSAAGGSDA